MTTNQLFLAEPDVPPGAVVVLYPPGSHEPAKDDENRPLPPLQCLIGGVSRVGPRFYPVDTLTPDDHGMINTQALTGFHTGCRFVPTQVYGVADAPADTKFAVFQNGRRLECSDLGCTAKFSDKLRVVKAADGSFKPEVFYDCGIRGQLVTLPPDVILVPITDIGAMTKKAKR